MTTMYLVTGGCGFLGNEVVQQLRRAGKQVRIFDLQACQGDAAPQEKVPFFPGDVVTGEGLDAFLSVPQGVRAVVIHTAGIIDLGEGENPKVYGVNVTGTRQVVDACLRHGIHRLVHVASVHAIPPLPKGQVMTEPERFDPDKVVGWYAKTKATAAQAVVDAVHTRGLNASIVFPSGIWGPGDRKLGNLVQVLKDYWAGKLPAGVDGGYDFVDVRDAANGIIACADQGRPGEHYILGGHFVTVRQMLDTFQQVTGKPPVRYILPMWLARASLPLLQLHSRLSGNPMVFTKYALYTLSENAVFSIEKARRELNYAPRPFQDSLDDAFKWLKASGLL